MNHFHTTVSIHAASLITILIMMLTSCGRASDPAAKNNDVLNRLIPLPKEITVERTVEVPAGSVRVTLASGAGDVERNAIEGLRKHPSCGGAGGEDGLEILAGVPGPDGFLGGVDLTEDMERLRSLPNGDQGYVIRPAGERRLVLAALTGEGIWNAA